MAASCLRRAVISPGSKSYAKSDAVIAEPILAGTRHKRLALQSAANLPKCGTRAQRLWLASHSNGNHDNSQRLPSPKRPFFRYFACRVTVLSLASAARTSA